MPNWIIEFVIIPIITGLFTSLLFLSLLSRIRPQIEISENIARVKSKKYPGKHAYVIKVVNKSKRAAIDVQARFAYVKDKIVPDGTIKRITDFKLEKDTQFEIPGFDKNEPDASNFRFLTYDDIEEQWDNGKAFMLFVLYAKDSFTGFGKVVSRRYYLKRVNLKDGTFKIGPSADIV